MAFLSGQRLTGAVVGFPFLAVVSVDRGDTSIDYRRSAALDVGAVSGARAISGSPGHQHGTEILGGALPPLDYLIRLSSQRQWMHEPVAELTLRSSGPVVIAKIILRKGD